MDAAHSRQLLEGVLTDPPRLHRGELEISRPFAPSESLLPEESVRRIVDAGPTCYSVHRKVAEFIFDRVQPGWSTLEVGLGVSTLTFALRGARHVCITPFGNEIEELRNYARGRGISLGGIDFVAESSDTYLPRCAHRDLDLVLIDGKHAFPFPIVDWYYTADRLRRGGLMLIDDAQMKPVRILQEFMDSDPRWERVEMIIEKTFAFRKVTDTVHDTAWHMQPYVFQGLKDHALQRRSLWWRVRNRVRRLLGAGQV